MKRTKEFYRGCLIGGAIGDALGWPVEFLSWEQITRHFGPAGIQDLVLAPSGKAEVTDDTQMTLFTAEGLLRAEGRGITRGMCHPPSVVYLAYQRWLYTQGYPKVPPYESAYNGWLLGFKDLYANRAPGKTCLEALLSQSQGTIKQPINNSKGCGGVMRVAPVGLFYEKVGALYSAAEVAALTHGHPSGYLSAGALAYIISSITEGLDLPAAVRNATISLKAYAGNGECVSSLHRALELAAGELPDIEAIAQLGHGWVGEEALAIAVYCSLKYPDDFRQAVLTAVNHGGDSDSTGAITGNILGAYLGLSHIPTEWVEKIELREAITQIADDLLVGHRDSPDWWSKYPVCDCCDAIDIILDEGSNL